MVIVTSLVTVLVYVVVFPSSVLLLPAYTVLVSCLDWCETCFEVMGADSNWISEIFAFPEVCALYFHTNCVEDCSLLQDNTWHRLPVVPDVRRRSIKASISAADSVDTGLFSV
jgi:hypothetical protein